MLKYSDGCFTILFKQGDILKLRGSNQYNKKLSSDRQKIMAIFENRKNVTLRINEIRLLLKGQITDRSLRGRLSDLAQEGFLERVNSGKYRFNS